jgi:hypothetical protein
MTSVLGLLPLVPPDPDTDHVEEFAFGLDLVLDGLEWARRNA